MTQSEHHAAVNRLLDENVRGLVLYARQWDAANAEDLVQEAFLRLLTETPFPDSPKAWLFRVVRNLAIDQARREKLFSRDTDIGSWFEPMVPTDGQVAADLRAAEYDLTEALAQLPPGIREIIISKVWGNLNFREIAELTGRPISSVHSDYWLGIKQLRTLIGARD
jgi:RNA polymerase sigma-70 factor (ECF subfamily)